MGRPDTRRARFASDFPVWTSASSTVDERRRTVQLEIGPRKSSAPKDIHRQRSFSRDLENVKQILFSSSLRELRQKHQAFRLPRSESRPANPQLSKPNMVVFEPHEIVPEPISDEIRAIFTSPTAPTWCAQVLDDPTLRPIATRNRDPKVSTEDSLVAETLATDATIPAWQSFYRPFTGKDTRDAVSNGNGSDGTAPVAGELISLLYLGRGMNGHADIVHGGVIAAILDDTMGTIARSHRTPGLPAFTAYMTVQFKKPLPTPGAVLCRSWLERRSSGKKLFLRARVEDGEGGVYAEAECLYVEVWPREQKM